MLCIRIITLNTKKLTYIYEHLYEPISLLSALYLLTLFKIIIPISTDEDLERLSYLPQITKAKKTVLDAFILLFWELFY